MDTDPLAPSAAGALERPHPSAMVADELFVDLTPAPLRSFEDFYRDSHERMARALTLTLGNRSLALDATDEAFARAWSRWATVCSHTNPEGWVYRVALNWATSWLRKVRRERPDVYIDRPAPATGRDLDLDRALERLSVDHRSVVVLRHLGGWSTEEVANALEISPGTVKSRLSRALDQLSADLNDPERSSP